MAGAKCTLLSVLDDLCQPLLWNTASTQVIEECVRLGCHIRLCSLCLDVGRTLLQHLDNGMIRFLVLLLDLRRERLPPELI